MILPTTTIKIVKYDEPGDPRSIVIDRCLLDTGSEISIISHSSICDYLKKFPAEKIEPLLLTNALDSNITTLDTTLIANIVLPNPTRTLTMKTFYIYPGQMKYNVILRMDVLGGIPVKFSRSRKIFQH